MPWEKLQNAVAIGVAIAVVLAILFTLAGGLPPAQHAWWAFLFRWLHVVSGVMWVGLLWYFNFVQIPSMPKIPDEQKPAVSKVIAPAALFWFRWAALATLVTGLILASMSGWDFVKSALTLGLIGYAPKNMAIGIGMWLGIVMAFNVWFIIWPNQQKALGLVTADADAKKKAARMAMLTSRFNTALSVPMLYAMVAAQNLF